jgi:hypothetical protein
MRQSVTDPSMLADVILRNMRAPARWAEIPVDGARQAARAINELL